MPATLTTTITTMERRTAHSALAGDRPGIYAVVELSNGESLELSRLDGEDAWIADAAWGKGSFPRWCHGFGARYMMTKAVSDPALVADLDAMAAAL